MRSHHRIWPLMLSVALSSLSFSLLAGCRSTTAAGTPQEFFIRTDGYVTELPDQPHTLSFTYYREDGYDDRSFAKAVAAVRSEEVPDLTVTLDRFEPLSAQAEGGYLPYHVGLTLTFPESGTYSLSTLVFDFEDGTSTRFPLGELTFAVDDTIDPDAPVIYNDIAATATPDGYAFSTSSVPDGSQLQRVRYGTDQTAPLTDGQTGALRLENVTAPLYLIRPAVEATASDGSSVLLLGTECTCGALEVDADDIAASRQYAYDKQNGGG